MDRKDFLNSVGMSAAAFALLNSIGYKKTDGSSCAALLSNGGSLVLNGLIAAKTKAGTYMAMQRCCTHESYTLTYQYANNRFYCPNHGATFSENGAVTNGPASRSLTIYTQLTGTTLKVYS